MWSPPCGWSIRWKSSEHSKRYSTKASPRLHSRCKACITCSPLPSDIDHPRPDRASAVPTIRASSTAPSTSARRVRKQDGGDGAASSRRRRAFRSCRRSVSRSSPCRCVTAVWICASPRSIATVIGRMHPALPVPHRPLRVPLVTQTWACWSMRPCATRKPARTWRCYDRKHSIDSNPLGHKPGSWLWARRTLVGFAPEKRDIRSTWPNGGTEFEAPHGRERRDRRERTRFVFMQVCGRPEAEFGYALTPSYQGDNIQFLIAGNH